MKNKASGGSQPRKEEGASHLARRGKNAEAFLNLEELLSSVALAESFCPVLFLYFGQHFIELFLLFLFLLPGLRCLFFSPYLFVPAFFLSLPFLFSAFFFGLPLFFSLSLLFSAFFFGLSLFFPVLFFSLPFFLSAFFYTSFLFPALILCPQIFCPRKEIKLSIRTVIDSGTSYADQSEHLSGGKESVRTGKKRGHELLCSFRDHDRVICRGGKPGLARVALELPGLDDAVYGIGPDIVLQEARGYFFREPV